MYSLLKENVFRLIKECGFSVRKVERDLGFGYGTLTAWDVHMPSIDKVEKVAAYFGVTVDYLLGNMDKPEEIDFLRYFHDNSELRMLFDELKEAPPEVVTKMRTIAKLFNENGGTP